MVKNIVSVLCYGVWITNIYAQPSNISDVLGEVEQNNIELKAMAALSDSRRLELKSANNLPDPQLLGYYLPFGDHIPGDYTEFEISQTFEFPTVYGARGRLIDQQTSELQFQYQTRRQEILARARNYCLEIIYLNKRNDLEKVRVEQAERVYRQMQGLFDKGQVGKIELSRARVTWMQEQFKVRQVESDIRNILLLLQNLNGGLPITFGMNEYPISPELSPRDSLWQEKATRDPALAQIRQQQAVAEQQLRVSRNKSLPSITAGFNQQGIENAYYSGLYAGLNIPIWNNMNKVKAARYNLQYRESYTDSRIRNAEASFEKQYNNYQLMVEKFREYQATLSDLDAEELLLQASELGQISFLEYYFELQFYRQAYDAMLSMEYELYRLQTELLKHRL